MDKIKQTKEKEKKILYRFFFVLLKPGRLKITNARGKTVNWRVAKPSGRKSVIAFDMDMARVKMRKLLKKEWTGFQILAVKEDDSR